MRKNAYWIQAWVYILIACAAVLAFTPSSKAATEREEMLENQVKQLLERVNQLESRLEKVEGSQASDVPPPENPKEILWEWKDGLTFSTRDGSNNFKLGGRIHNDWYAGDIDNGNFPDGTRFRRVRLNLSGTFLDDFIYKTQFDFAGSGTGQFKDVYVGYTGLDFMDIKVGQFKEPFGLEELTSSNYITMMERSPIISLAPSRETGIMFADEVLNKRMTWAVGAFKNSNAFGDGEESDAENGDWDITGRITGLPWYEDNGRKLLHLGVAGSHREWSDEALRIRSRGSFSRGDYLVDTAAFNADSLDLLGAEAALVYGPASVQAEYIFADVDPSIGNSESIHSYYVQGSYFLTGESRPYKAGAFSRVKPNHNFSLKNREFGAWELTARYSYLDLSDITAANAAGGGDLNDLGLGLNWYLNPNSRLLWNYIHSEGDQGTGLDKDADIFQMRLQYDF